MRWYFLASMLLLAGCATARVLGPGEPHDATASLLELDGHALKIQPLYGNSEIWTPITSDGLWVMEGHYLVQGCFIVTDVEPYTEEIYVAGGHSYKLGCNADSMLTVTPE